MYVLPFSHMQSNKSVNELEDYFQYISLLGNAYLWSYSFNYHIKIIER